MYNTFTFSFLDITYVFIGINYFYYVNIYIRNVNFGIAIEIFLCMLHNLPSILRRMESYFYKSTKSPALLALIKITGFEEVLRSLDPAQDTS